MAVKVILAIAGGGLGDGHFEKQVPKKNITALTAAGENSTTV